MEAIVTGLKAGAWTAAQGFFAFITITFVYNTTKNMILNAEQPQAFPFIWKGFIACALFSLFMAAELGEPTCDSMGDYRNGCEEYNSDGYEPSDEKRARQFAIYFLILYGPLLAAALDGQPKGAISRIGSDI